MITVTTPTSLSDPVLDLSYEALYRFLSAGFSNPCRTRLDERLSNSDLDVVVEAADLLRETHAGRAIPLGFGELPAEDLDARRLAEMLRDDPESMKADYVRVFGLVSCRECPPYESEYLDNDEPFFRAQHLADLAGFYRAFGLEPSPDQRERPDFVATELEFAALLLSLSRGSATASPLDAERRAICEHARQSFLADHLAWWLPSFSLAVRHRAETGFFYELAKLLSAFLPVERHQLGVSPPRQPQAARASELPIACEGCLR